MINKISAYDLKVTLCDSFPLQICDSSYLQEALDSFEIIKPVRKNLKKLIRVHTFRKAFTYLFWVIIALKF